MNKFVCSNDLSKIKFNVFNLSKKEREIWIDDHSCSKYLRLCQIFLRGEFRSPSSRKAILSAYDMQNGNLMGKIY